MPEPTPVEEILATLHEFEGTPGAIALELRLVLSRIVIASGISMQKLHLKAKLSTHQCEELLHANANLTTKQIGRVLWAVRRHKEKDDG